MPQRPQRRPKRNKDRQDGQDDCRHNLGLWDRYSQVVKFDGLDYLMGKYPARTQLFIRSKAILVAREQAWDLREELGLGY